ncbi:MAG: hypothetical protein ACLQBX_02200 [Candidatus Limnocylindrales bacterium]
MAPTRGALADRAFFDAFHAAIRDPAVAPQLQAAADGSRLLPWTELLTNAVVTACNRLGLVAAAKGSGATPLPFPRQEYLGIDVLAFGTGRSWRLPVAAVELENSSNDRTVAYALWKACAVRAELSCLVCYRREPTQVGPLAAFLGRKVLAEMGARGDVLVVIGTRSSASTFPDGYFRPFRFVRDQAALLGLDVPR